MTKFKKIILKLFLVGIILLAIIFFAAYKIMFSPNIIANNKTNYLYVRSGAKFQDVIDSLEVHNFLKNKKTFTLTSKIKKYELLVKAGKYKIDNSESNWHLINKLRSGNQTPVNVVVPSVRTILDLCQKVSPKLELTQDDLSQLLNDKNYINSLGFDNYSVIALFIPNTYEFYWNTSAQQFVEKMKKEYDKFWTEERLQKAKKLNLSPLQVSTLASIVQAEQMQHTEERPRIAGLYLNRLNTRIPLQSDPTVVYAMGDFSIKRVLNYMLKKDSPYNTYLYPGLPPGPILIPEPSSIDAVLNPEKNDYIYMCAKDDFSGYHYFSTNLTQHLIYAKRYHNALN